MIHATFDRRKMELRVEGHADYAPRGQDIVCAAVSILYGTLCAAVEREEMLHGAKAEITEDTVRCRDGERVKMIFETVWQGLRLLERSYGAYLCCREK